MPKRPSNIKLDVVKPPANLIFSDRRQARSVYVEKLQTALAAESVVRIKASDAYMLHQLRKAAAKVSLKLAVAYEGEFCYVKPIEPTDAWRSLVAFLREPRTMAELEARKYELDLKTELAKLKAAGHAEFTKRGGRECWVLTEAGEELVG